MPILTRQHRFRRDLLRQRERAFGRSSPARHDAIDRGRCDAASCGRDHVAGEQHFHGVLARDVARQRHHRRRAEQADMTPGVANFAPSEATARSQLATSWQPAAVATPCDGGDHRLRQVDDLLHHARCSVVMMWLEIGAAAIGVAAARGHFLQIVAGAEGRTVGRQDDGADLARRRRSRRMRQTAPPASLPTAVARLRPVEREQWRCRRYRRATARATSRNRGCCCARSWRLILNPASSGAQGKAQKRLFDRMAGPSMTKAPDGPAMGGSMPAPAMSADEIAKLLHAEFPQAFYPGCGHSIERVELWRRARALGLRRGAACARAAPFPARP